MLTSKCPKNLRLLKKINRSHFAQNIRCASSSSSSETVEKFATCPQCVFSGIQPTGVPHLGNYVGAVKKWVQLQQQYQHVIFSVVDLHSITVPQDPDTLRENIYSMTACLLACGIDPHRCILFQQSTVPYHTELAWILSCLCTLPQLKALPQWKEKSKKYKDPSIGLFTYPILQAADILLYKATDIPVGEDQTTHIEIARDLARAFNRSFGLVFPKPVDAPADVTKIRSLRDPDSKMSKSEINPLGRIELLDSPDEIREKLKKAKTDSIGGITYELEERPGVTNLVNIHSALTGLTPERILTESFSLNKVEYKFKVADIIIETFQPIKKQVERLLQDRSHIQKVLDMGTEKASAIASVTMEEVKKMVGLR